MKSRRSYYKTRQWFLSPEQKEKQRQQHKAWLKAHPGYTDKYVAKYHQTPQFKKRMAERRKRLITENPERRLALYRYHLLRLAKLELDMKYPKQSGMSLDDIETIVLKRKAMWIRSWVRRLFNALDETEDPEEILNSYRGREYA